MATNEIVKRETASSSDIAEAVAKCLAWTRTQMTEKEVIFLVQEVQNFVNEDFQCYCLTSVEVGIAFRKGVFGEYGKYYGVNAVTLMTFLKEYVNSDEFLNKRHAETKKLALPPKKVSDEEVFYSSKENILDDIRLYKEQDRRMPWCTDYVYNFLADNGIIKLSIPEKERYFNKAANVIQSEKKHATGFKLQEILRKYADATFSKNMQVTIAKRLALRDFLESATEDTINQIKALKWKPKQ